MAKLKRFAPLAILLALLLAAWSLGLRDYLSLDTLSANRAALLNWVEASPLLAALAFVAIYALVVATSLPGGLILTLTGGFLFGTALGAAYVVIAATSGALCVFLAARTALGSALEGKVGGALGKIREGFAEGAASYMLVLRLVPIFPFWLVNLAPAFTDIKTWTYVWTTFLGVIPGTVVFASIGAGLGAILDRGETPDLSVVFDPVVLGPLLGLAGLSLIPVIHKKWPAIYAKWKTRAETR